MNKENFFIDSLFLLIHSFNLSSPYLCAFKSSQDNLFTKKLIYYCKYLPWQENLHLKCILVCEIKAKKYGSRTINYSLLGETIKGPRQIAGQSGQWHVYYIRRCDNFLGDASAFRAISIDLRSEFRSN